MPTKHRLVQFAALVLATQLSLVGCGHNLSPAESVNKAQEYLKKGDLQSASVELSNALQKDPNVVDARWLRAGIDLQLGDAVRAEQDVRKAIELGFPQATAQFTLAKAIFLQGDLKKVLSETGSVPADATPLDRAMLLGLRGEALILLGRRDEARPLFEQALQIEPHATTALIGMAILHTARREYEDAETWAKRALEADAVSPEAWGVLGEIKLAQGKPEEAETAYSNVIKYRKYPSLDKARRALARVHLKKFKEAEADIQALKQQGWKDHPYVNYVAGLILFEQKKYPEAAAAFEASSTADPSFVANRMYLAATNLMLGKTEQALTHAQYAYANAPASRRVSRLLSAINVSRSEYAAAREVLQTALSKAPDDRGTLRMLATVSLLEGDGQKGVAYASKLAALDPKSSDAQGMLMAAKLVANQELGDTSTKNQGEVDDYTRDFLLALDAFRKGRIGNALEAAKKLNQQYPDKVDPINLMAACYMAATQWDMAKTELNKALSLKPNEPSAARNLASIEVREGNLQRARTLLQGVLKENPKDEEAALLQASIEVQSGNAQAAMTVLEQTVQANPGAMTARERLAGEYLRAGKPTKVLELTGSVDKAQLEKHPSLLELRGKAQMFSGDVAAARGTFEQWTKLAPRSAAAYFYLSDSLARTGQSAQARKQLERAMQLDSKYLPARIGEVKMLVHSGDMNKAKQVLAKLRPDFGELPEVLAIEGWFALGTRDPATAEQRFAAALKQKPDAEMTILLARSLWLQNKHDASFDVLQSWLKNQPRDVPVLLELAGGYLALNRLDEASATYAKVLEVIPGHVPALNNLAWLNREKNPGKAMEYAQRARDLAPSDPHVLDTLSILALNKGNTEQAANLIREAAQHAPEDPQIQLHLGTILVKQGRNAEAREVLGALVRKVPNTPSGKEAKALLDSIGSSKR